MPSRPALIAEFLGTFALVFAGTGAVVVDALYGGLGGPGISAVFGIVVMIMIYAVGEISGAHLNPAVSIAFAVARRFPWRQVPAYAAVQIIAAIMAAMAVRGLIGEAAQQGATLPVASDAIGIARAAGIEFLLSWILMFVILGVCTGAQEKGLMAGVAIGAAVALCALFGGPLTGASMNPARSIGPALIAGELHSLWLYCVMPVLGTCAAVGCLCLVQPKQCCTDC